MSSKQSAGASKRIFITLEDGRVFSIDAMVVAEDKAKYYGKGDPHGYAAEMAFVLSDNYELLDWLYNNMDWYELNPREEKQSKLKELKDAEIAGTQVLEVKE